MRSERLGILTCSHLPALQECRQGMYHCTTTPLINGVLVDPVANWMTICPLLFAVAEKFSSMALLGTPALATMSKLLSTVVPLMTMLNALCRAAVNTISAKCSWT